MPKKHENWHAIYMKFNRWPKNGIIQRIFEELQSQNVIDVQGEILWRQGTVEGFLIEKVKPSAKLH